MRTNFLPRAHISEASRDGAMVIVWVYLLVLVTGMTLAEVSGFQGRIGSASATRGVRGLYRDETTTKLGASRHSNIETALNFRRDVIPELDVDEDLLQQQHQKKQHLVDLRSDTILIREAKRNEIASVVSLRVNVFYPELRSMSQFHSRIYDKLCNRILRRGSVCLAAFRDEHCATEQGKANARDSYGNILGTIEVSHNDFVGTAMENVGSSRKLYCCDLAVQLKVRRQGLATKLLKAVENYAFSKGYDELYLHVEKGNNAAEALYLREGYQVIPSLSWAVDFTESHLQKGYDNYVFLWKRIHYDSEKEREDERERDGGSTEVAVEILTQRKGPEVVMLE